MSPKTRLWLAWISLIVSLVGWPISLVFVDEPKVILSLSWIAISYTAWNVISTADVRVEMEEDE